MDNIELWLFLATLGSGAIGAIGSMLSNYLFPDKRRASVQLETANAAKSAADASMTTAQALNQNANTIASLGSLLERQAVKFEAIVSEHAADRARMRDEIDTLKKAMATLEESHIQQIKDLQGKHEAQIKEIQDNHKAEMTRLLKQHQDEMATLKAQHRAEMERLKNENNAAQERIGLLEKTLKETQTPDSSEKAA